MSIRYVVLTTLLASALLASARAARAGIFSPSHCTVPSVIRLVGSTAGAPDSVLGKFMVVTRYLGGTPATAVNIVLDFSACPDLHFASDQRNPNVLVNCALRTVSAYTDGTGEVDFTVIGSSFAAGTYSDAGCLRLTGDGVTLPSPIVAAFDLDGANGIGAADLAIWLADLGSGTYRERSDYDGNGRLGAADLSLWLSALGRGGSAVSGTTCP